MSITLPELIVFISSVIIILIIGILIYRNISLNKITEELMASLDDLHDSIPKLDIDDRLTYTEHLLSFIDNMIEFEVVNEKRFELILGQYDKNLDIDKVLESVSTRVYESIEKNVFTDPNNILTSKYIMEYIQKKTFFVCMQYVQNNTNNQIE